MSISSRKLKADELPDLRLAQLQAARMNEYWDWLAWMRETFSYSVAVRMAIHLGYKVPGHGFYTSMRKIGKGLERIAA